MTGASVIANEPVNMYQEAFQHLLDRRPIFPVCSPLFGEHQHWREGGLTPCVGRDVGKVPLVHWKEFQTRLSTEEEVTGWWKKWPDANIGMATGALSGVVVLDVDGQEAQNIVRNRGVTPTPVVVTGRDDGFHYWFAHPGCETHNFTGEGDHVDGRGDGGYVLLPNSLHVSGRRYHWAQNTQGLPAPTPDWLLARFTAPNSPGGEHQPLDLTSVLDGIPEGERDQTLWRYACKLRGDDIPREYARTLVSSAARLCRPPFDEAIALEKVERAFRDFKPSPRVTLEIVKPSSNGHVEPPDTSGISVDSRSETPDRHHLTDLGNSERFVDHFGNVTKYCKTWGDWLDWDGRRWRVDATHQVLAFAKQIPPTIYLEAADAETRDERTAIATHARRSESAAALNAMLQLARSALPAEPSMFDRDPWLLNVRNGTIDLRTGDLRPHQRDDLITKLIDLDYEPENTAPRWLAVLERVLPDESARVFFHRAAGYSATGSARERCVIMMIGPGRNGKGVCIQAVRGVLGDYAVRTPAETFMAKRNEGIPNDVAALRGARMVYSSETNEGRRLAEATIKDLTGGEEIAARFMRGEWFSFTPTFTPWLASNHKPVIRGTDLAIWDRIRLLPFTVRIPDEEQDRELAEKLQDEYPGILAWIVRGAVDWYKHGLGIPEAVRAATGAYRDEMDILGSFLEDQCVLDPQAWVLSKDLFAAYERWCETSHEQPMKQTAFGLQLTERGFDASRQGLHQARTRSGLRLRGPDEPITDGFNPRQTGSDALFRIDESIHPREVLNREIASDPSDPSDCVCPGCGANDKFWRDPVSHLCESCFEAAS